MAESGLEFRVYYTPPKFADGTVVVCHHGAGYSGLTFAYLAKELVANSGGECGVLALDCRGHGAQCLLRLFIRKSCSATGKTASTKASPNPEDLSIDVLTADLVNLISSVFPDVSNAPTFLVRFSHDLLVKQYD